jgi:hypothetical protein
VFVWALWDMVEAMTGPKPSGTAYLDIRIGDTQAAVEDAMGPPDGAVPGTPGERCLQWVLSSTFISLDGEGEWVVCFRDGRVDRKP